MTRDPSGGGYLFLGDDYLPRWGMTWVPIRDGPAESVDDVKHFLKPLSLQFEKRFFFSRTFNIRPEDYLIISDMGNVCLGVLDGTSIGYDSVIIIGDVSLCGKLIAYDNDENEVGWIDSDCSNPRRQSKIPSFLRRALHNQLL